MHVGRDIIRSQMFYSVYTKVTHSNHQRTSTHTNLAQPVLVSQLPEICRNVNTDGMRRSVSKNYLWFFQLVCLI